MPEVIADPIPTDSKGPSPSKATMWLRGHVGTRAAATVWWLVMVPFSVMIISWWVHLAIDPTWIDAVVVGLLSLAFGIPIAREWPHARRMGRMLIHGT